MKVPNIPQWLPAIAVAVFIIGGMMSLLFGETLP